MIFDEDEKYEKVAEVDGCAMYKSDKGILLVPGSDWSPETAQLWRVDDIQSESWPPPRRDWQNAVWLDESEIPEVDYPVPGRCLFCGEVVWPGEEHKCTGLRRRSLIGLVILRMYSIVHWVVYIVRKFFEQRSNSEREGTP